MRHFTMKTLDIRLHKNSLKNNINKKRIIDLDSSGNNFTNQSSVKISISNDSIKKNRKNFLHKDLVLTYKILNVTQNTPHPAHYQVNTETEREVSEAHNTI